MGSYSGETTMLNCLEPTWKNLWQHPSWWAWPSSTSVVSLGFLASSFLAHAFPMALGLVAAGCRLSVQSFGSCNGSWAQTNEKIIPARDPKQCKNQMQCMCDHALYVSTLCVSTLYVSTLCVSTLCVGSTCEHSMCDHSM